MGFKLAIHYELRKDSKILFKKASTTMGETLRKLCGDTPQVLYMAESRTDGASAGCTAFKYMKKLHMGGHVY